MEIRQKVLLERYKKENLRILKPTEMRRGRMERDGGEGGDEENKMRGKREVEWVGFFFLTSLDY